MGFGGEALGGFDADLGGDIGGAFAGGFGEGFSDSLGVLGAPPAATSTRRQAA
jgi:hypothetical protein